MNGTTRRAVIVGGGAAGFFAAITCAEKNPNLEVILLEKAARFLGKVRISGGGRCNVTHSCFDARQLSEFYPRGGAELRGPFQIFQPQDTIAWFESRGVNLKTESDGRIFPVTDSSETIIDCLMRAAQAAGVDLRTGQGVATATALPGGGSKLKLENGELLKSDLLMLATGGCRTAAGGSLATALGHSLESPVPSLFTFHVAEPWIRALAGISVPLAEVSVAPESLRERGPLLLTHAGLSGPAVLKLSAWGARQLHQLNYQFSLSIDWLPGLDADTLSKKLEHCRVSQAARLIINSPLSPLASRLWESIVLAAGVPRDTRWSALSNAVRHRLVQQLKNTELRVTGKTLNQEEFVTCGGVKLSEVNFKTMESRLCPGLFFGGELLDIDGLTGGFNFQSAWTTGWVAGQAMAGR